MTRYGWANFLGLILFLGGSLVSGRVGTLEVWETPRFTLQAPPHRSPPRGGGSGTANMGMRSKALEGTIIRRAFPVDSPPQFRNREILKQLVLPKQPFEGTRTNMLHVDQESDMGRCPLCVQGKAKCKKMRCKQGAWGYKLWNHTSPPCR